MNRREHLAWRIQLALGTFGYYVRNRHPLALIRAMLMVTIGRWPGELCQTCGRRYYPVTWHAPDDLWLAVHGSPFGLLCPACFVREAAVVGIEIDWTARRWDRNDSSTWDTEWGHIYTVIATAPGQVDRDQGGA